MDHQTFAITLPLPEKRVKHREKQREQDHAHPKPGTAAVGHHKIPPEYEFLPESGRQRVKAKEPGDRRLLTRNTE